MCTLAEVSTIIVLAIVAIFAAAVAYARKHGISMKYAVKELVESAILTIAGIITGIAATIAFIFIAILIMSTASIHPIVPVIVTFAIIVSVHRIASKKPKKQYPAEFYVGIAVGVISAMLLILSIVISD